MTMITVSDAARAHISAICNGNRKVLMVSVNNKGCSGHSYEYSLVDRDQIGKLDELVGWDDGGIVVSSKSVMHLIGSHLDLVSDGMQVHLSWKNPQAVDVCGCGESFSVS